MCVAPSSSETPHPISRTALSEINAKCERPDTQERQSKAARALEKLFACHCPIMQGGGGGGGKKWLLEWWKLTHPRLRGTGGVRHPALLFFKITQHLWIYLYLRGRPIFLKHFHNVCFFFFFLRERMKSHFFLRTNQAQRSGEEKNIFLLAVCLLRRRRNSRLLICCAC